MLRSRLLLFSLFFFPSAPSPRSPFASLLQPPRSHLLNNEREREAAKERIPSPKHGRSDADDDQFAAGFRRPRRRRFHAAAAAADSHASAALCAIQERGQSGGRRALGKGCEKEEDYKRERALSLLPPFHLAHFDLFLPFLLLLSLSLFPLSSLSLFTPGLFPSPPPIEQRKLSKLTL